MSLHYDGSHSWNYKPIPIPPYLLAIAAGNIAYRAFSHPEGADWTSGVWTEPEMMERSFWEFSEDTPKLVNLDSNHFHLNR
jgi:leukotriene-A4 hydrolase